MDNSLLHKLDEFIRKYYKNQLIRGGIYTFTLVFLFFLSVVLLEYFGNFSTTVRGFLFFSFIGVSLLIMAKYIAIPLFKLNKMGKVINYETAAQIIGNHFGNVKDKLLNTLQLMEDSGKSSSNEMTLLTASVNQRITELKPVPFTNAIDLSENKKYVKYAIIPLLIFLFVLLINANIISSGTDRIINYSNEYIPKAPFQFNIKNNDLSVIENEDFELEVSLSGSSIPNEVFVEYDGKEYKLNKKDKNTFTYLFNNVQEEKDFKLSAASFSSKEYTLTTIPNAIIMGFKVELDYPAHTGIQDQTLENIGDLNVPQGTKIKWTFNTKNTNQVSFGFTDTSLALNKDAQNLYTIQKTINKSERYTIKTANDFLTNSDSVKYFIEVKQDEYPQIAVNEKEDSLNTKLKYFNGQIADDYGFTNLAFFYRIIKTDSSGKTSEEKFKSQSLPFEGNFNKDQFYHFFDFKSLGLNLGDKVEYYFQVWDNDKVNGYKSARTRKMTIKAPTKDELSAQQDEKNENIKKDIEESLKDAQKLQKDVNKLKEDILNKKNLDWQDKKKLDDILQQQKDLQNQLEQINNENQQKNQQKEDYNQQNEELKEKQDRLEELMEELNSDEMKELYEKLEKMSEKLDKNQLQETLEQMDLENLDLKKELERSLEMFKQMEMDEKLDELSKEMEELSKKQEDLANDKEKSNEQKEEEQKKIDEEFKELEKEMDKMKEKNEELENKRDMEGMDNKEEAIKKDMQESIEKLQQNKSGKAQEKQKDAAEKMKEMAQQMQSMMSQNNADQTQENMEDLRALLENLVTLSFDQEALMQEFKTTSSTDPRYVKLGQQQRKLKDDAKMIEDSLFALSKRVEQIQSIVNKEMNKINYNIKKSLEHIGERQTNNATVNQQFTMTSINNLALLLDEALKQMQQQMANQIPGSGSCNNPGGSNPKPGLLPSMKQAQDGVSKSLQKLREQMGKEKGQTPGQGKDGQGGQGGNAKELARMAAEQAALREKVKQMSEQLNQEGTGAGNGLKKIEKDMEKVEEDIINQNITRETIQRQQDILTRLLESEKAIREREFDKERESKNVKNQKFSNPDEFLEYKRKKEKELELLKTIPPSLLPYYRNKVNEYFNQTY